MAQNLYSQEHLTFFMNFRVAYGESNTIENFAPRG